MFVVWWMQCQRSARGASSLVRCLSHSLAPPLARTPSHVLVEFLVLMLRPPLLQLPSVCHSTELNRVRASLVREVDDVHCRVLVVHRSVGATTNTGDTTTTDDDDNGIDVDANYSTRSSSTRADSDATHSTTRSHSHRRRPERLPLECRVH